LDVIPIESPSLFPSLFRSHHDRRLLYHRRDSGRFLRFLHQWATLPDPFYLVSQFPAQPSPSMRQSPVRPTPRSPLSVRSWEEDKMAVLRLDPWRIM
jgi:hypothetical protein